MAGKSWSVTVRCSSGDVLTIDSDTLESATNIDAHKDDVQTAAYCLLAAMGVLWPDNRPDGTGLDDGVYLPGHAPRKRANPKTPDELREIRRRAWETRRRATA